MKKVHFTAAGPHAEVLALADDEVRFHDGDDVRPPVHVPAGIKTTPPGRRNPDERALVAYLAKRISDFDKAFARRALNAIAAEESLRALENPEDEMIEMIDAERSGALAKILWSFDKDEEDEEEPRKSGIVHRDVRPPKLVQKLCEGRAYAKFTRDQFDWLSVLVSRYIDPDERDPSDTVIDELVEDDDLAEYRPTARERRIPRTVRPPSIWDKILVRSEWRTPKLRGKAHERRRLHDYADVVDLKLIAA